MILFIETAIFAAAAAIGAVASVLYALLKKRNSEIKIMMGTKVIKFRKTHLSKDEIEELASRIKILLEEDHLKGGDNA